ncbi:MAG: hypothetical protein KTR25_16230 [Myxococcales bacterium]|nr:hypothetical protein [Myxococcales bacterium]
MHSLGIMNIAMTSARSNNPSPEALDAWLNAVSSHLAVRRFSARDGFHNRNRERERARRQARKLFQDYYRNLAAGQSHAA